jgi:hypothetical protein
MRLLFIIRLLKKLLRAGSNISFLLAAASFAFGCAEEKPPAKVVAKVNNVYLTTDELSAMMDTSGTNKYFENEIIRNWIHKELLYQKALKEGIVDNTDFTSVIKNSEKELAGALLIKKMLDEENIDSDPKEVEDFFNSNKEEFRLFYDSYIINRVDFNQDDKAILFRSTVLESDWNKALNVFKGDPYLINEINKSFYFEHEIHPVSLLRLLKEMNPAEVSIVLNFEPSRYTLVQLVEKYNKGSIPSFDWIKDVVKDRVLVKKREEVIKEYIKELYKGSNIEVKY